MNDSSPRSGTAPHAVLGSFNAASASCISELTSSPLAARLFNVSMLWAMTQLRLNASPMDRPGYCSRSSPNCWGKIVRRCGGRGERGHPLGEAHERDAEHADVAVAAGQTGRPLHRVVAVLEVAAGDVARVAVGREPAPRVLEDHHVVLGDERAWVERCRPRDPRMGLVVGRSSIRTGNRPGLSGRQTSARSTTPSRMTASTFGSKMIGVVFTSADQGAGRVEDVGHARASSLTDRNPAPNATATRPDRPSWGDGRDRRFVQRGVARPAGQLPRAAWPTACTTCSGRDGRSRRRAR